MKLEFKHIEPYLSHQLEVQYIGITNGKELKDYDDKMLKHFDTFVFDISEKYENRPKEVIGLKVGYVKVVGYYKNHKVVNIGVMNRGLKTYDSYNLDFKPILHPIIDLRNMFEDDDEWIEEFRAYVGGAWCDVYDNAIAHIDENFYTGINVLALPYHLIEWFNSLHIDWQGLIEQGLAVDINTL